MQIEIDIRNYLPHRAPMLMVDLIIAVENKMVETVFTLKENNIFIQKNYFVEAGLIENAAQTCAAIVAKDYFFDENNQEKKDVNLIGFISALKTLKIHKLPLVGSTINTKAILSSSFVTDDYSLCTMICSTFCNEILLLEGEINLFIQDGKSIPSNK